MEVWGLLLYRLSGFGNVCTLRQSEAVLPRYKCAISAWWRTGLKLRTWQHRHISALRKLPGSVLAAEHAHGVCSGPQEGNALALQRLNKVDVLAQEAIAWMTCLAPACMEHLINTWTVRQRSQDPMSPSCGCTPPPCYNWRRLGALNCSNAV